MNIMYNAIIAHFRLQHYSAIHDVQTLAMLCCSFGSKNDGQRPPQPMRSNSAKVATSSKSPSDTIANNVRICISKITAAHKLSVSILVIHLKLEYDLKKKSDIFFKLNNAKESQSNFHKSS